VVEEDKCCGDKLLRKLVNHWIPPIDPMTGEGRRRTWGGTGEDEGGKPV
jgi:hypothetical protein